MATAMDSPSDVINPQQLDSLRTSTVLPPADYGSVKQKQAKSRGVADMAVVREGKQIRCVYPVVYGRGAHEEPSAVNFRTKQRLARTTMSHIKCMGAHGRFRTVLTCHRSFDLSTLQIDISAGCLNLVMMNLPYRTNTKTVLVQTDSAFSE
ncbi:hypothetical protein BIW11_02669 [Tropilaelaps mercedesae]|uniref:Uncharacterized protein n=1 Tax=Tropilaelaps mercedesae TaxID=418985 RepID=A0A1V9XZ85_9ACAR|nr:hypothetical protein BIW11_02669 [Tropilaelaps mercedesae]